MNLDPIDVLILEKLAEDGRASFRDIARDISVSTPTVSARFQRMMKAGFIRKFVPVMDTSLNTSTITALITVQIPQPTEIQSIAKKIAAIKNVSSVFVTTGENLITLRVSLGDRKELEDFINKRLIKDLKIAVIRNEIIISIEKDELPLPIAGRFGSALNLKCDFCHGEVSTSKPPTIRAGPTRYFFCCKTCKASYLSKYGEKIKGLNKSIDAE